MELRDWIIVDDVQQGQVAFNRRTVISVRERPDGGCAVKLVDGDTITLRIPAKKAIRMVLNGNLPESDAVVEDFDRTHRFRSVVVRNLIEDAAKSKGMSVEAYVGACTLAWISGDLREGRS